MCRLTRSVRRSGPADPRERHRPRASAHLPSCWRWESPPAPPNWDPLIVEAAQHWAASTMSGSSSSARAPPSPTTSRMAEALGRWCSRGSAGPEGVADIVDRGTADLPLIEHLQRGPLAPDASNRLPSASRVVFGFSHHAWPHRQCLDERGHLHGGQRGFASLVVGPVNRAGDGLLLRQRREHAEGHRDTGIRPDGHDAVRHGGGDVLEMHRLALMTHRGR